VCLADRNPNVPALDLLRKVAETGDLGALGDLRYAYVKAVKGQHKSRVVGVWTDGALNFTRMFPEKGDVPGEESSMIPRPVASRRVFTITSDNAPYGIRRYESTESPDVIYATFDKQMAALGWERAKNGDIAPDHRLFIHATGAFCEAFARKMGRTTEFSTVEMGHTDKPLVPTFDPSLPEQASAAPAIPAPATPSMPAMPAFTAPPAGATP
jgi:hypothetical protein